ncbi:kynurenine formamidase isoform X2 [Dendroctonus ponderosae]|uniref:kynurenine formamidase isoform X2 n=1 Tax=Dendroctonus ponderosae TaxID=77166 RepID=UPI002035F1A7|nr:kynurenine formamidase isoform X2 [Dendroctonus ponderosae]
MEDQLTELDKLYFPHKWQKRFPFDQVLEEHIKFFNKETEKLKKSIRCELNVPYGLLPREKYDIIGIDLPDVHVHGGYWQVKEISHSNQGFLASVLHKNAIKLAAVGYELCPELSLQEIMLEIEVAIRRILDYAKKNKSRGIYLSGHSVGAHLVAALFSGFIQTLSSEEQSLVKAVFLSCGLYDLGPLTSTIINEGLKLTDENAKLLSPQNMELSSPEHVSVYVVAAEEDSPAFLDQSKAFYEKLKNSGFKVEYRLLEQVDHFNAVEKMIEEDFEATQLFLGEIRN